MKRANYRKFFNFKMAFNSWRHLNLISPETWEVLFRKLNEFGRTDNPAIIDEIETLTGMWKNHVDWFEERWGKNNVWPNEQEMLSHLLILIKEAADNSPHKNLNTFLISKGNELDDCFLPD